MDNTDLMMSNKKRSLNQFGGDTMSAIIGMFVGIVIGVIGTVIALVVISDWREQKDKER